MVVEVIEAFSTVAESLRQSTVRIRAGRAGVGSGVIWRSDGWIISNAHVVRSLGTRHRSNQTTIELADGREFLASVVLQNVQRDLVALHIEADDLPAIAVGDSDCLRAGELVFAVGHPLGVTGSVTMGVIQTASAKAWVQADVQLAPGNSGGVLANARGEVIGINTMIVNRCGWAIPSRVVEQFLDAPVARPHLGVTLEVVKVPLNRRPAFGLLISAIAPNSPAAQAEFRVGDVLIGVRGAPFQTPHELTQILDCSTVGDGLALNLLRGEQHLILNVILQSPSEPQAA
ncbi:MAG: trypsin-like peptidase domain-containing protein [Myxacorys californica WJT36-NPBG1]|jgi:serine protease Do|nr:trypsin-like peptidase domain-containing protein [Myxacorys californica WJT36-NPBG1]